MLEMVLQDYEAQRERKYMQIKELEITSSVIFELLGILAISTSDFMIKYIQILVIP